MKMIPLSQGKIALVDDEDYVFLNQFNWYAVRNSTKKKHNKWYAKRHQTISKHRYVKVSMHREILNNVESGKQVDHINGDGLDNRRENLRICTNQQNSFNKKISFGKSKYKGVFWNSRLGNWYARIVIDKKGKYLGSFKNESDAASAYNSAAIQLFGDYANLNIL